MSFPDTSKENSGGKASISDRFAKFKKLKQRKNESEKLNKQELFKEYKHQKTQTSHLKNLERKKVNAEEQLEKLESEQNGEDYERKRAWDWTIEEHEKWDAKLNDIEEQKKKAGFQNYNQLAESSYLKELKNLEVDQDEYEEQKNSLMKMYGVSDGQFNGVVDFTNKPSQEAIDRLISNIDGSSSRKMKRRKNKTEDAEVNSYINDKNKMFNQKLNRHYDKYEDN